MANAKRQNSGTQAGAEGAAAAAFLNAMSPTEQISRIDFTNEMKRFFPVGAA